MKVGDKVWWSGGGWHTRYEIREIGGETKTQWILDNGTRFRKDTLRKVGDHYGAQIEALTPEAKAKYNQWRDSNLHNNLWRKIQDIKQPHHLSTARLQEIYNELVPKESR